MKIKHCMVLIFVMATIFVGSMIDAQGKLFLENHYGAPIVIKVSNSNRSAGDRPISNQETTIQNQSRVLLGLIPYDATKRGAWVNSLDVKTARLYSSYTSLNNFIENISDQVLACCTMKMNTPLCRKLGICNATTMIKDAVIVIYPSNIASGWDVQVQWLDMGKKVVGW